MEMDDQSFFAGDMPIRLLCPSFNKEQTPSLRYTAAEKEVDISTYMTLKHVNWEIQENRNGRK